MRFLSGVERQLISVWHSLSDLQTEAMVNDSFSAMRFCGLSIEDNVPDHSTLSRFRTELTWGKSIGLFIKKAKCSVNQTPFNCKQW